MASPNEAQAVKSLNTTPGLRNRRFVFKSCAQQIDELEINVFRNLDTVKAKPSSGSCFFLDCLIHWRELNTAEDFISLYEELMPLVQTLSLALLRKDMIIKRLLSRLQMKARLSLEAIFRLIAELSRDLGEEFEPFLPRIIESYLALLKDKAVREPEIIEQMFTSLSYIMMYLQRYLTKDVVHVLKIYGRQSPSFLCIHTHGFVTYPAVLLHYTLSKWESKGKKIGTTCLTSTSRMFLIASSLCSRLKAQLPDKGVRRLVKCNLAFAICGIQTLLRQTEFKDPCTFWSSLDSRNQGCFLKACQLLDTKSGRRIMEVFTCGFNDENFDQKNNNLSFLLMCGLLNTMGKPALQTEDTQTKMILGSLRLIAEQTTQEDCLQYAYLLFPIYKLCEGFSGKAVPDDVKKRAEKVREKIQANLGTQNFVQVYYQMRHDLGEKRFKRKQDEKLMAVINPIRNAKRKMRVSAKHQAHKKRKMMVMKMDRWMH